MKLEFKNSQESVLDFFAELFSVHLYFLAKEKQTPGYMSRAENQGTTFKRYFLWILLFLIIYQ